MLECFKVNAKSKLNPFALVMHILGLIVNDSSVHVTSENERQKTKNF